MTRYQYAMATARALDHINQEMGLMYSELADGLTIGQKEDVKEVVRMLLDRKQPEGELSEEQVTEVTEMIVDLTEEFSDELEELAAEVANMKEEREEAIAALEAKIATMDTEVSDELAVINSEIAKLEDELAALEQQGASRYELLKEMLAEELKLEMNRFRTWKQE